jgi:hypothetical protein
LWCSLVPKDPLFSTRSRYTPLCESLAGPFLYCAGRVLGAGGKHYRCSSLSALPCHALFLGAGSKHHRQQRCAPYTALPCCHALARPKLAEHAAQALGSASVVLITRIQDSRCQRTTGTGQVRVPECDAGRARTVQPLLSPV